MLHAANYRRVCDGGTDAVTCRLAYRVRMACIACVRSVSDRRLGPRSSDALSAKLCAADVARDDVLLVCCAVLLLYQCCRWMALAQV